MEYHRLGDDIREENVRNRDLKVAKPMGINIEKYFLKLTELQSFVFGEDGEIKKTKYEHTIHFREWF